MVDKEKQIKRQEKWIQDNYDRVNLRVPKGMKAEWQDKAKAEGKSLTEWIIKRVSGN